MFLKKNVHSRGKRGQKAQGMVEYALIIGFVVAIGVVLLMVRPEMREAIGEVFTNAAEALGFSSS